MATWFTSDWHLSHRNIIDYCDRPIAPADDEQMIAANNELLVARHNELVAPGDDVWVLGDVAMGRLAESLAWVSRFNGNLHLVAGNHDRCWSGLYPGGRKPQRRARMLELYRDAGFASITEQARLELAGQHVLLSHFPYVGDSQDRDRYVEFRPTDRGAWLVHGHVHDAWRQRGRQINVGVDAWQLRPVNADVVAELIAAGPRELDRLEVAG